MVEFGNYIKRDRISNILFFLFYILVDHPIAIDTAELLQLKNISVIPGWKFHRNCLKRKTDFETDDIRDVNDLYNTTEGEKYANLLEYNFKKLRHMVI